MKKLLLGSLAILFCMLSLQAQKGDLMVRNGDKGPYLDHKVVAKESFFSVGRLYNLHPATIAAYNKLDLNKGLFIDQKIRIPLNDSNFTQKGNSGTPVYYRVGDNEGLLKVSQVNGRVPVSSLRAWNHLSGDVLKKDQKLIIGFLLSREMKSITIEKPKEESKEEKPVEKTTEKPEITAVKETEVKEEPKLPAPVAVKEEPKPMIPEQGYFKTHFEQQVKKIPVSKEETVTAGIFKTASGWQDTKYYLLIDAVQPGMVVKVINPTNNRAVYAKVLGAMSGIRQNEGLNIRISNAAASVLGIEETDKFIVKISY